MNLFDTTSIVNTNVPGINMPVGELAATATFAYGVQRLMRSRRKLQLSVIAPILGGYAGSRWLQQYSTIALAAIAFAFFAKPAYRRFRRFRRPFRRWRRRY